MARRMRKAAELEFRRVGGPPAVWPIPWTRRWYGRFTLLAVGVAMLTLAFAPYKQCYLAWFGLVPWLIVLRSLRSQRAAFLWSWGAGTAFFIANMWWMAYVTLPGMLALLAFLGLYWGAAGMIIRGTNLLHTSDDAEPSPPDAPRSPQQAEPPPASLASSPNLSVKPRPGALARCLAIAAIWVASEWLRGCFPFQGLPWLYLGHAQSPLLPMCQIADFSGVFGVSFWVAAINAAVALFVIERLRFRPVLPALIGVALLLAATAGYGLMRVRQSATTRIPGPRALVVQPNFPQDNGGNKGASYEQIADFHLRATADALEKSGPVDVVLWSETMMPALNRTAREELRSTKLGAVAEDTHKAIQNLALKYHTSLVVGGMFYDRFQWKAAPDGGVFPEVGDRRNSAYLYEPNGLQSDQRYDKIHLVPWGEMIPFKYTIPWLYRMFLALSPYDSDYTLTPGGQLPAFQIKSATADQSWRCVAAICFEDIDASLVARMFRPDPGQTQKRADFLVNITNDGWFKANEMPQHLQAAVFRSIENRVPTARSVNTGISGFIDPLGRIDKTKLVPAGKEGWSVATLTLDRRLTWFTRLGDAFGAACALVAAVLAIIGLTQWWRRRTLSKADSQ